MQDAPTRLVWITMLAMKDKDGLVKASVPGLAHRARVTLEECQKALGVFLGPDPHSTSKVDDGRRVREVAGGWVVINHEMYQYANEEKRDYWKKKKAEQRLREKGPKWGKKTPPLAGEVSYVKGVEMGTVNDDGEPIRTKEDGEGGNECLSNRL